MPLQLSAEPLQFAAGQHGPAVLALQLVLLLHHLEQLPLQKLQLLLVTPVLLQLQKCDILTYIFSVFLFYFCALMDMVICSGFPLIFLMVVADVSRITLSAHQLGVFFDDGLQFLLRSAEFVQTLHQQHGLLP